MPLSVAAAVAAAEGGQRAADNGQRAADIAPPGGEAGHTVRLDAGEGPSEPNWGQVYANGLFGAPGGLLDGGDSGSQGIRQSLAERRGLPVKQQQR